MSGTTRVLDDDLKDWRALEPHQRELALMHILKGVSIGGQLAQEAQDAGLKALEGRYRMNTIACQVACNLLAVAAEPPKEGA